MALTVAGFGAWTPDCRVSARNDRDDTVSRRSGTKAFRRARRSVRRVIRGLTRRAAHEGRTPRQAAALTARALEAIRATAHLRRTGPGGRTEGARTARRRGRVDVALISVMRDAMLRRSEAAALTWADVEFRSDGSARVTVRRSKSDQDGNGATLYVGTAAATALRAIRGPDASPDAPVFGLRTGRAVSKRIGKAAKAAVAGSLHWSPWVYRWIYRWGAWERWFGWLGETKRGVGGAWLDRLWYPTLLTQEGSMHSRSGSRIRHGYSVVRVSLDDRRDHTVPVGVVAWQTTKAVSEILTTAVRLDLPKAMNPMDEPDTGIESLFEAVVQPGRTGRREAS